MVFLPIYYLAKNMNTIENRENLYVFIDESGNFGFENDSGSTKWFILTSLVTSNMDAIEIFYEVKHKLIKEFPNEKSFHATANPKKMRHIFFTMLKDYDFNFRVDALLIEKRKLNPTLRIQREFYSKMIHYLLKYVFDPRGVNILNFKNLQIFVSKFKAPKGQNKILENAIKGEIKRISKNIPFQIVFHPSETHPYFQIVDYFCWAIYKKYENNDNTYYDMIKKYIFSEFDIFKLGYYFYY
jgi:hypothetical protein